MAYEEGILIGAPSIQNQIIFATTPTSCDAISTDEITKGLSGVNENRFFVYNHEVSKNYDLGHSYSTQAGIFNYSFRGDYSSFSVTSADPDTGGDVTTEQWFQLGNTNSNVFKIMNIGGTLYVFKTSAYSGGLEIYRKESYYSDAEELIDNSSFTLIFQDPKISVPSWRSINSIGGTIWIWVRNIGLCYLEGNNLVEISQPITSCNIAIAGFGQAGDVVVIPDERYKLIMCYESSSQNTYVYDLVKRIWYCWRNIPLSAIGFASSPSIFGTSDYAGVRRLGEFPTSSDTMIPTLKTGSLNFGYPEEEKFLRKLTFDATGITAISIYMRNSKSNNFTLYQTINTPGNVINFPAHNRFREMTLEITGNATLCIKSISAVIDIRREYT